MDMSLIILTVVGSLVVAGLLVGISLVVIGTLLVVVFISTRKILIPRLALLIVSMMEIPIKHILWALHIEHKINGQDAIDLMIAKIRNKLYVKQFAEVPFEQRAIFLPQCIRHPDCPARLSFEGIMCVECGRCPAARIKKEAEKLGYKFFIAPGGSFVERMIKKYKPKAIIGVGCHTEIKEGTALTSALGIPAIGIPLTRDGCMNTTTDWEKVIDTMRLSS